MAAWFNGALSQGLANLVFPFATFPLSCGAWVNPSILTGTQSVFAASIVGTGTNYLTAYIAAGGAWTLEKTGGGVVTAGNAVANQWHYLLMRAISATSCRLSVLDGAGSVTHINNVSAGNLINFSGFTLGDFRLNGAAPTNFFTGGIGEFWYANYDIVPGTNITATDELVRRLAYSGPISPDGKFKFNDTNFVFDYRSMITNPVNGHGDEVATSRNRSASQWTNTNGVMNGPHPPLPPGYGKIRPVPSLLVI